MNHEIICEARCRRPIVLALCALMATFRISSAAAAEPPAADVETAAAQSGALKGGTIGYVLNSLYWSMYQTANGKTECPRGFNDGPREQFAALFPVSKPRRFVDTQLKYEAETWNPTDAFPRLAFHVVDGPNSYGMNLDGKVSAEDFTSPDGEKGIDNQLYRTIGCINGFRGPEGVEFIYENQLIALDRFNRMMIEISGIDDMSNDKEVIVSFFRGTDRLMTDATGNKIMPGGTQRIDVRWGASLMRQARGQIVDGVLITQPLADVVLPWQNLSVPTYVRIRDSRLKLSLTPLAAEGMIAGYADLESWYKFIIRNDSTHHLGDGQISAVSMYQALVRLADAYPDEVTKKNTAISSALDAKFTQVFIQHPQGEAAKEKLLASMASRRPAESASERTANR